MHRNLTYFLKCMHSTLLIGCILSFSLLSHSHPTAADVLRNFTVFIPIFLGGILIDRVRHLFLYLLYSAAIIFASYSLGTTEIEQFLYLCAAVIVCLLWFYKRTRTKHYCWLTDIHPLMLIPFVILYGIAAYLKHSLLQETIYYSVLLYCVCLFLHTNLDGFTKFFHKNADRANIPFRQIQTTNDILLLLFGLLAAAIFLLLPYSGMQKIFSLIGQGLLVLLKWLLRLLVRSGDPEDNLIYSTEAEPIETSPMGDLSGEPSPFWEFIGAALLILVTVSVIIGILVGLAYILYSLYKRFYAYEKKEEDKAEFLKMDMNSFRFKREKTKTQSLKKSRDPSAQVRKLYKKSLLELRTGNNSDIPASQSVLERSDKNPLHKLQRLLSPAPSSLPAPSMTPEEIEKDTRLCTTETAVLLHQTYEKARYSREGCSQEEASALKETLRQHPLEQHQERGV